MKKILIFILIAMNLITINADKELPIYKIIANSNSEKDIQTMYDTKDALLKDYAIWVKGIDDKEQALADHTNVYQAEYYNGEYVIILGKGEGKEITGTLQTSYCTSSKDITKKSWLEELLT
jgi:hypothetical protein